MPEYDNLKIPLEFRRRFEVLKEKYRLHYTTYPEFVKDALRHLFDEIEKAALQPES